MLGRGVTTCTAAATAGNVKMRFTPAVKQASVPLTLILKIPGSMELCQKLTDELL